MNLTLHFERSDYHHVQRVEALLHYCLGGQRTAFKEGIKPFQDDHETSLLAPLLSLARKAPNGSLSSITYMIEVPQGWRPATKFEFVLDSSGLKTNLRGYDFSVKACEDGVVAFSFTFTTNDETEVMEVLVVNDLLRFKSH